jgi:hypothetical protein
MRIMLRTIDYAPLTTPVTAAEANAFKQAVRARGQHTGTPQVAQVVVVVVLIAVFGFMVLSFGGVIVSMLAAGPQDGEAGPVAVLVFALAFLGIFVTVVALAIRGVIGSGGRWQRWLRLDRFANANGLVFSPADANPQYPGAIFSQGRNRVALDHFRSATDRFLDYGNYRYVTGSGKNSTTHNWGFMAMQLDRSLPHMVLDSRANNGLFGGSNLPATFTKDQVLQLEGDFNEHFTLYCPKQYERDALYVFTPDLMALLIDEAAPFDVEIVDKWMFVYSARAFDPTQPALHQRLLRIVDTVGAKTLSQTDRYTDERVGDFAANIVAPQGQRLKRGVSVGAIIVVVVVAAFWFVPLAFDMFGVLFRR